MSRGPEVVVITARARRALVGEVPDVCGRAVLNSRNKLLLRKVVLHLRAGDSDELVADEAVDDGHGHRLGHRVAERVQDVVLDTVGGDVTSLRPQVGRDRHHLDRIVARVTSSAVRVPEILLYTLAEAAAAHADRARRALGPTGPRSFLSLRSPLVPTFLNPPASPAPSLRRGGPSTFPAIS